VGRRRVAHAQPARLLDIRVDVAEPLGCGKGRASGRPSIIHHRLVRSLTALVGFLALVAATLVVWAGPSSGAPPVTDEAGFRAAWTTPAVTSIDLGANITLTCPGGGVADRPAGTVAVDGHGYTITQTCPSDQVLLMDGIDPVSFANVTITGGQATGGQTGGGVKSHGPLTFTNAVVTGNSSTSTGGGISALAAGSSLTLSETTVSNNHATAGGGGAETAGSAVLTNSTVSGNTSAAGGAGISAVAGVTMTGSTVSGNTATAGGGGIAASTISATNSTIVGNTAGVAGGGGVTGATVTLDYVTVTQNDAPTGANVVAGILSSFASVVAQPQGGGQNCLVTVPGSQGFNFSDDGSCGFTLTTDHEGAGDPVLGPLANNGGPTETRLPLTASPLIDAIPVASCQADGAAGVTTDQRGVTRPQGPGCDIGAVEVQVTAIVASFTG
jgi:hypothetical protein